MRLRQTDPIARQALEEIRRMAETAVGNTQRPHVMPALEIAHDILDVASDALRRDRPASGRAVTRPRQAARGLRRM